MLRDGPEVFAQNLAHRRLGQRVEEADLFWHLVRRELACAVSDQVRLGERGARGADDEEPDRLARPFVRLPDAGAFSHTRAGGSDRLDLVRIDVEAGDDDHVLLAIDDLEIALGVEDADVAGAEVAVGRESLPGRFRLLPVRPPIETTFSAWTTMSTSEAAKSS